ncbi:hypothetical protein AB0J66_20380 [Actinoplanes sp. NPDC049598]|uniref:hypothetical protein n=1 Tax=Actinoplanes sp. NPDC049598 TaxID=3154626 RepID=UPI003421271B
MTAFTPSAFAAAVQDVFDTAVRDGLNTPGALIATAECFQADGTPALTVYFTSSDLSRSA